VLLVRVYALCEPATISQRDEYAGCKSWVDLDVDVSVEGSQPVIAEDDYQRRADQICSSLRGSQ
jgi:hypothetical protein